MRWPALLVALALALTGCFTDPGGERPDEPAPSRAAFVHDGSSIAGPVTLAPGWTEVHLANEGQGPAQAILFAVPAEQDAASFQAALAEGLPSWAVPVGGPGAAAPGASGITTVLLEPGHHVIADIIPGPTGLPAAALGAVADVEVAGRDNGARAPEGTLRVDLADFAYRLDGELMAGPGVIEVRNVGGQPHELILMKVEDGTEVPALLVDLTTGPPTGLAGGVGALAAEHRAFIHTDLQPGTYAFICFLDDEHGGPPHFLQGMIEVHEAQ